MRDRPSVVRLWLKWSSTRSILYLQCARKEFIILTRSLGTGIKISLNTKPMCQVISYTTELCFILKPSVIYSINLSI